MRLGRGIYGLSETPTDAGQRLLTKLGAPLSDVLERVGIRPEARRVFFFTFDEWGDSIDMDDALHPQTLIAYGMNVRSGRWTRLERSGPTKRNGAAS